MDSLPDHDDIPQWPHRRRGANIEHQPFRADWIARAYQSYKIVLVQASATVSDAFMSTARSEELVDFSFGSGQIDP